MFFYVTSGFLITYTLSETTDRMSRATWPASAAIGEFMQYLLALTGTMVLVAFLLLPGAWQRLPRKERLGSNYVSDAVRHGRFAWRSRRTPKRAPAATIYGALPGLDSRRRSDLLPGRASCASIVENGRLPCYAPHSGCRRRWWPRSGPDHRPSGRISSSGRPSASSCSGHLTRHLAAQRWRIIANPLLGVARLSGARSRPWEFVGSYAVFDGRRFWLSVLLFTLALPGHRSEAARASAG